MFTPYAEQEIRRVATAAGAPQGAVLAVAAASSGGQALVHVHGRTEPSIVFLPHVFYRRLRPEARPAAVRAGLACQTPGAIRTPASQRERHALFARARLIDRDAAHAACAWGLGRAPGEMARRLGFESAEALADEARAGVAGQARLMLRMIDARGLRPALEAQDWETLAAALAPTGGTAEAMAEAYARYAAPGASSGVAEPAPLASGAWGADVRRLQQALRALDADTPVHGLYDAQTGAVVRRFQRKEGLPRDGVAAGPFWPRLRAALSRAAAAV